MSSLSSTTELSRCRASRWPRRVVPLLALCAVVIAAISFVISVLWPRWPEPPLARDAPALPITVAGVAFNVPPAAVRVRIQRRSGSHERIDLAFLWPSLAPPDPAPKPGPLPKAGVLPATAKIERIFVTISAAGTTLPLEERLKSIYPRHVVAEPVAGPEGLAVLAFREGTPYQGEDLIYEPATEPATSTSFLVRCTRNGAGPTPGTCLYDERIEGADLVVRFPRDWLADWRAVAASIETLIRSLRPAAG